ncbi:MAG: hypothetical protein PHQ19_07395 [Candidatus Krumholzibacteria bacterium]|nr:hypothetical protein [Candidatus Krumholzibacteria bacterium]
MDAPRATRILTAALGFCAACAQALVVRETLSMIAGTELLLGLIVAAWLFWTGAGGLFGGRFGAGGPDRTDRLLRRLAFAAAGLVPATVILIRLARAAGGWPIGATVPFAYSISCCLLAPAPFAIVYGMFYNAASAAAHPAEMRRGIISAYALEAGGAAAGAALFPLLVASLLTQVESAVAVAIAVGAATAAAAMARRAAVLSAAAAVAAVAVVLTPSLDRSTMSMIARGYAIERIEPSRHGDLAAVRDRETVSIYSGSSRIATIPPTGLEEEAIHVPLLAHPAPRSILLIGGAVGGGLEEALRHPGVERIDWIELDPGLASLVADLGAPSTSVPSGGGETAGPRIRGIAGDGRWHISRRGGSYDAIIVSAPPPATLRWNRYYTEEFFRAARTALAPGGVLAISHPSSENFLSSELVETLAMIERTLGRVFAHVRILPGVTARILASDQPIDLEGIPERLRGRGMTMRYLQSADLAHRCSPGRLRHLRDSLSRASASAHNSDAHPLLVTLELALEGARAGGPRPPRGMAGIPPYLPPAAALALLAAAFIVARRKAVARAAVFSVGMSAMLLQLTVMLAFQSYSGLLYHAFIVMTALFMAGAAAGAAIGREGSSPRAVLGAVHAGFVVLAIAVPLWLRVASEGSISPASGIAGFLALPALAGCLAGVYYRTVVGAAYSKRHDKSPAVYYAWDLFGAVAGALIGGALMIPLAGTAWTAVFIAALNGMAALALGPRTSG